MKTNRILLCLACILSLRHAPASDIAPYLEDSTIAVARIDLDQVDIARTIAKINELAPGVLAQPAQTGANLIGGGIVASLKRDGVEHLYAMLSTIDIMQSRISLFVPARNTASVAETLSAITGMLPAGMQYQVLEVEDGVLVAPPEVLARLRQRPTASRPELDQNMPVQPATLTLTIGLKPGLRQSVVNLLSDQPPLELPISFSPKEVVADVKSVSVQLVAPELSLVGVINAVDPVANKRLNQVVEQYRSQFLPNAKIDQAEQTVALSLNQEELLKLLPTISQASSQASASTYESNNLKQVTLAMWNFYSAYKVLPPRMSIAEDGTPLLSWRVHLLPFMNEQALYDRFHLDEAWNSPHNIQLLDQIPALYQSREYPDLKPGYTCVMEPICDGSLWSGQDQKLLTMSSLRDGTSNTIAFVVAPKQQAIPWTKPEDLTIDRDRPLESLFGDREQILFALLDGSVQTLIRSSTSNERILAALTHQGSEMMELRK